MVNGVRTGWEPENLTPLSEIAEHMRLFLNGRDGVSILGNGTLLFINKGEDDVANAKQALEEAKFLTDFRVKQLNEGGYLVALHKAVAVFVGQKEFETRKPEIIARFDELKFPSEELIADPSTSNDELLVGVYGRGKLQRDVYSFSFYQRV
ncbi:hypothetical protein [Cellvibrio sp.]